MRLFSQDTKVEALKRASLFEGLSRKELTQLARVSEDMEIRPARHCPRKVRSGTSSS